MFFLILLLATLTANAGNLGNSDFATCAYWSGAGGSIAQCLNTSKIYDSTNAQLLDTTIAAKLNSSAFTDAAVTSKLLTGYVSGAGVVAATDSILQAIQKLNGNIAANGSGDVVGPVSAVDGEIALFDGVTGKLIKSATGTGIVKVTSGVFGTAIAGDFPTLNQSTTGNAATATALAANPSDCGAGTKATAIDASGNLTCSAVSLTADVSGTLPAANLPAPATSAIGASDIDWSLLKNVDGLYTKTLAANTTLTFSNVTAGQTIVIAITNTASNYTLTWPAAAKWSGGTAPTQTIGAKTDVYTCKAYDSTNAYCTAVQNY